MVQKDFMNQPIIMIVGPTGIGKTELSIKLAKEYNGEIINADASQLRKELNIGTAKVDWKNQGVPHHLFDIVGPVAPFSVAIYQKLARDKIKDINTNGKIPFLVGGSGLYINAVIGNYNFQIPQRNENFSVKYDKLSNEELYEKLLVLDPLAIKNIHINNRRRVLRAIEMATFGYPISKNNLGKDIGYYVLIINLECDREVLYDRINERTEKMFALGWCNEVQDLINKGYNPEGIKEIGYKEIYWYLSGKSNLVQTKDLIKQKTRRYAKRQLTWFRHQIKAEQLYVDFNNYERTINSARKMIDTFITKKT